MTNLVDTLIKESNFGYLSKGNGREVKEYSAVENFYREATNVLSPAQLGNVIPYVPVSLEFAKINNSLNNVIETTMTLQKAKVLTLDN